MTTTTTPAPPTAFFAHTNPTNPLAQARHDVRRADFACWRAAQPHLDADIDTTALSLVNTWGLGEGLITAGLRALFRLDTLPGLKALQDTHCLLDIQGLIAIDKPLSALAGLDAATLALIDATLVSYFTPTQPNQVFPTTATIRRRVRDLAKTLDPTIAFRDTRPKDTYTFSSNGTKAWLELGVDEATGIAIDAFIRETATKHDLSLTDAIKQLLTGAIEPPATIVLHTYKACDVDNSPTYINGYGWRSAPIPHTKKRDLTTPVKESDSYQPSGMIRSVVEGRDETCRLSGCDRPAMYSQLDHRHNYAEGGKTHPSNMACLCQHHHNMKTDGRLGYVMDPDTGDIVWLFDDSTWATTSPEGPLSDGMKRWVQTVGQHITAYRKFAREQAQYLKQQLDDYHAERQAEEQANTEKEADGEAGTDTSDDIPF